jgi:5'-3' exonuclease
MTCDLIIDGNYLLNRMVFTLHKNNLLFGALFKSLDQSIINYRKMYPFSNVYLVSDSKEKSWRKKIDSSYKANRTKNTEIDWEFVFNTYNDFKDSIRGKNIKVLEAPHIEGDDWISYVINNSNSEGRSTLTITNDYDIKQLVKFCMDPLYINFISNEMYNNQKIFLPRNYSIFVDKVSIMDNHNLFDMNDNLEFLELIKNLVQKNDTTEIDPIESLIVKLISGDTSDNIPSAWSVVKNGRKRGIADRGAKTIFEEYINQFGEPDIQDPDLSENIADLICEKKKLSKTSILGIKSNIESNMRLIHLDTDKYPKEVLEKMKKTYESL